MTELDQFTKDVLQKYPESLSLFSKDYNPEDLKTQTKPSGIVLGGTKTIELSKLQPKQVEKYLWMHTAVPRGIEIKANRMTNRGYYLDKGTKEYRDYCERILENSGGITDINQWIQDAYAFGNSYRTFSLNGDETEVVRLNAEHPVYFDIRKYPEDYKKDERLAGKYKISNKTRQPKSYTQLEYNSTRSIFEQTGKEIPANRVAHLVFDKWGDEVKGISVFQYIFNVVKYLLNIEEAGAETMWRHGFTQKKITTNIKTKKDLEKFAQSMRNVNARDAAVLPDGVDMDNLLPGQTQFKEFHDVFITLVSVRLGIPKPLLLLDGTSTNKATLGQQAKDMRSDLAMDEIKVKEAIENQIFYEACKLKFGDDFKPKNVPEFHFHDVEVDRQTKIDQMKDISTYMVQFTNAAATMAKMGRSEEAGELIRYAMESVDKTYKNRKIKNVQSPDGGKDGQGQVRPENEGVPPASKELKDGSSSKK